MKKTLTLAMLLILSVTSFAQKKNIKVIDRVEPSAESFSRALGSNRYTIDSLAITGYDFYPEFFYLIKDCCEKGRLTGIDMSRTCFFGHISRPMPLPRLLLTENRPNQVVTRKKILRALTCVTSRCRQVSVR